MRELSYREQDQVSGGLAPAMIYGAAISGTISYLNGDSAQMIAASAALGALTGGTASMSRITSGFVSLKFRTQTTGLTIANSVKSTTASGTPRLDVKDLDKELES